MTFFRYVAVLALVAATAQTVQADSVVSMPTTAKSGPMQDVVVPIKINPATGMTAMDLVFEYDEAVANPTGVFRTAATDAFATLDADLGTPGVVSVSLSGGGPLSGAPEVAWVVFRLVGPAASFSDLVWTETTLNGGALSAQPQNGRVTVISATASVGSPDTPTGGPGTQVQVPVFAIPASGAEGFDLGVRFNQNVVVPVSVQKTSLTSGMTLTANLATPGEVRAALFGTAPISGSGPIVIVTYNVVGALSERTPLDVFRGDINEQSISSALDDGLFTVCTAADGDGDGFSSCAGDCNDANSAVKPGALEVCNGIDDNCSGAIDEGIAAPNGAPLLVVGKSGGDVDLSWSGIASSTGYDVLRGDLTVLSSSGGDFTAAVDACIADDLNATAVNDPAPSGSALWYLVRAVNCGGDGTYDSSDPAQIGQRDAEISASPDACP